MRSPALSRKRTGPQAGPFCTVLENSGTLRSAAGDRADHGEDAENVVKGMIDTLDQGGTLNE